MKVFIALSYLVVMTLAEPPSYRQQSQADRTYYFAKQQEEPQGAAPYQASGWRPDGPSFELPQKQTQNAPQSQYAPAAVANNYGAPALQQQQQFAQPQSQYGAPAQPQGQYGVAKAAKQSARVPDRQYGASVQVQNQYGAPAPVENSYGAPAEPQRQYGAPAQVQNQYGTPAEPQRQYGAPVNQYGTPAEPQQQYGAPLNQYGTPAEPQRQYGKPANQYGAPAETQRQYGTPNNQYGAPKSATDASNTDYDEATVPTATESQAEPVDSVNELEEEGDVDEQQRQAGEYYIALPDGRLQRVQYMSSQDIAAMKYYAQIQAENVEPLRGSVYSYQPLQKLQFAPTRLQVNVNDPATPVVQIEEPRSQRLTKAPAKLQIQPLAAKLPAQIVAPVSSFQTPEQRYLVTF